MSFIEAIRIHIMFFIVPLTKYKHHKSIYKQNIVS